MPTLFCPKSGQEQDTSNEVGVSVMSKALNKILGKHYCPFVNSNPYLNHLRAAYTASTIRVVHHLVGIPSIC